MDGDDEVDAPVVVVRRDPADPRERAYVTAVEDWYGHVAGSADWRRWWTRSHEGTLTLTMSVGDERSYPRVERVDGGVVATICRREIDFADDDSARAVALTNVRHLFLTAQDLLDLKEPPEL